MRYFRRILWAVVVASLIFGGYLLLELSTPYLQLIPNIEFLRSKALVYHIDWWRIAFYLHVFSSPFVYFAGLMQFQRFILKKRILHKVIGKIYLGLTLFIAAPSGFLLGLYANGGYLAQYSFCILSLAWFVTSLLAFSSIRKGKIRAHTEWILRSYFLALSAVTLRLYSFLFDYFHLDYPPQYLYGTLSLLSWVPNLLLAEWLIRRTNFLSWLQRIERR